MFSNRFDVIVTP